MNTSPRACFESAKPDHWRNLLWALATPDIAPEFSLPWLPEQRRRQLHQFFSASETITRLQPKLEANLQTLNSHRLGVYFEQLWDFAFTHHPDYTLLARNLAVRSQEQTLGELDFVVRYLPDNAVEHWEVAVKFYLQVDGHWVGPGLRDRLDIKLARMRDHQLPIAQSQPAVEALRHRALRLDRQWTLMPGRLFCALDNRPSGLAGRHWWADAHSFRSRIAPSTTYWLLLPKPAWLANGSQHSFIFPGAKSLPPSEGDLRSMTLHGPACVAGFDGTDEVSRGFIVPDDWCERAQEISGQSSLLSH